MSERKSRDRINRRGEEFEKERRGERLEQNHSGTIEYSGLTLKITEGEQ
jgi:hypothetical protein